jgi:hypothetical protein
MNTREFGEKLFEIIWKRFKNDFPEYFVRCQTLDKELYNKSNQSGYSYYLAILNSFGTYKIISLEPNYYISDSDEDSYDVQDERFKALKDAESASDIRIWCFDNITLR